MTLDVGQGHELAELRARALACGAVRAHVVDARDDFARDVLFPSLATTSDDDRRTPSPRWPGRSSRESWSRLRASKNAGAVAHGSTDPAV